MSETDDISGMTPPAPRVEPFGESGEGKGARRERSLPPKNDNFIRRTGEFLHDTRIEMRRVTWPTPAEIKNTTIITLICMIFFAAYLYGVDQIWGFLIEQLVRLLGGA